MVLDPCKVWVDGIDKTVFRCNGMRSACVMRTLKIGVSCLLFFHRFFNEIVNILSVLFFGM